MKIYTRTGDTGQTALFGGARVAKDHRRVSAYGDIDELNAVIGLARAVLPPDGDDDRLLAHVQQDLFAIGGHLAAVNPERAPDRAILPEGRVSQFEDVIDRADAELPALKAFILPAGAEPAARLHHARTVCRRAERQVVALDREEGVPPIILSYLNRLSDLLFTLARLANHRAGHEDVTW